MTTSETSSPKAPAIDRARTADYPELMRLLDRAFGKRLPNWFTHHNAARYQPTDESMACNLIARRSGRIAACVGVFPIDLNVAGRSLRVAGVGGVCTDAAHRGSGLMRHLMAEACAVIERDGYALSFLTGQRQRYAYFGWEKAGRSLRCQITRDNLRHCAADDTKPPLAIAPLTVSSDDDLKAMKQWHDAQWVRCERPIDDFADYLTHWGSTTFVARDDAKAVRGYAVLAEDGREISELAAADADAGMQLITWLTIQRDGVFVDVGPISPGPTTDLSRQIVGIAETTRIADVYNWKVIDWRATLDVLLHANAKRGAIDGITVIKIEGEHQALRLSIDDGRAEAAWTDEPADLAVDRATATRSLFGPMSPGEIIELLGRSRILDAWCPLPLWLGRQDHI